jgi:hypothetical protein
MLKFIGFCAVVWFMFHFGIAQAIMLIGAGLLTWLALLF